jgi:1-phosphofructokinase family hexose kinase
MIATITLNPALDKTVYVRNLTIGDTNRIEKVEIDAGGKGVNASRMLAEMGVETIALGFVGGKTGRFIENLLEEDGIKTDFVHTKAETRTNIGIQDLSGLPPTALNERGGPITTEELAQLKELIGFWMNVTKIAIIAGSIPEGVEPTIYRDLVKVARDAGVQTILDADNEPLRYGLEAHPTVIKPNVDEAERLLGKSLTTLDEIANAAKELASSAVDIAVISMGKNGAVAATQNEVWHAVPPDVVTISTVGSGDSMVAGIALGLADEGNIAKGLTLGCAAGAATAMSSGVDMGKREDVERLLPEVKLTRIG